MDFKENVRFGIHEDTGLGASRLVVDELVHQLRNYQQMAAELDELIEGLKDQIKGLMTEANIDEYSGTDYTIHWPAVSRSSVDSKALLRNYPEVYRACTRVTTFRRFEIR